MIARRRANAMPRAYHPGVTPCTVSVQGKHEHRFWGTRQHGDGKPKGAGQPGGDVIPGRATIPAGIGAVVVLLIDHIPPGPRTIL